MFIKSNINYRYNRDFVFDEYIYGQGHGSSSKLKMGFFKGARNGCGWIATYNATKMLGASVQPSEIIKIFEGFNPLRLGFLGISPLTIIVFLITMGYRVRLSFNPNRFDEIAKNSRANIMFYKFGLRGHFFAFDWDGDLFKAYNVYNSQKAVRTFSSIRTYMRKKGWLYLLISIS